MAWVQEGVRTPGLQCEPCQPWRGSTACLENNHQIWELGKQPSDLGAEEFLTLPAAVQAP